MSPSAAPPRLEVFLARRASIGVILCRGPSDWAQLTLWDRETDEFTLGQWFRGRVYGRRCDLSPDGRLFVYFAAKQHGRDDPDDVGEGWTAVSRPPYFTALTLWRNLGRWYGGGFFPDAGALRLDATCELEPHPKFAECRLKIEPMAADTAPWEQRLLASGWTLVERGFDPRTHRRVGPRELWQKWDRTGSAKLCREVEDVDFQRYGGPYFDTYWLETGDDLLPLDGVCWADWDRGTDLVYTRDGTLSRARLRDGALEPIELHDFAPHQPSEVATPDWAERW